MLKLIETELLKLRRRKLLVIMLPAALIMPFFAMLLFRYKGETGTGPLEFYRWSAFGYMLFIILPVVLGIFCVFLNEHEHVSAPGLFDSGYHYEKRRYSGTGFFADGNCSLYIVLYCCLGYYLYSAS